MYKRQLLCCSADPLRVLRAVRFTSRYQFALDAPARAAAATPEVRDALTQKVARERVGTEVAGCLQGPHPVLAARLFQELDCFAAVFALPEAPRAALGDGVGGACVAALALAQPLLADRPELLVRLSRWWPFFTTKGYDRSHKAATDRCQSSNRSFTKEQQRRRRTSSGEWQALQRCCCPYGT